MPAQAEIGSWASSLWHGIKKHPIATALTALGAYNLCTYDWKGADKAVAQCKSNKKLLHEFKPHANFQEFLVSEGSSWSPISDAREAKLGALKLDTKWRTKLDQLINNDKQVFKQAQKSQKPADQAAALSARKKLIQYCDDLAVFLDANEQKVLSQFCLRIQIKQLDAQHLVYKNKSWGPIDDAKAAKLKDLKISNKERKEVTEWIAEDKEDFKKAQADSRCIEDAFKTRKDLLAYIVALYHGEDRNEIGEGLKFAWKVPISFLLMLSPLMVNKMNRPFYTWFI